MGRKEKKKKMKLGVSITVALSILLGHDVEAVHEKIKTNGIMNATNATTPDPLCIDEESFYYKRMGLITCQDASTFFDDDWCKRRTGHGKRVRSYCRKSCCHKSCGEC